MAPSIQSEDIARQFDSLRVWASRDRRAPHKPLLALLALARVQRGEDRLVAWSALESDLRRLLHSYGPPANAIHPEYPFWHLRSDGVWDVPEAAQLQPPAGRSSVNIGDLRRVDPSGGFSSEIDSALRRDPALVNRIAADLLDAHFPASLHQEILEDVGMPWVVEGAPRARDPYFRREVLRIYDHRCAVCGYDGRLEQLNLAIEAAHMMWHAAGGPDDLDNGVALCVLHHRALDRGALGFDDQRHIVVSSHVGGASELVEDLLLRYAGRPLRDPQTGEPRIALQYAAWHRREVFRNPPRNPPQPV